MLLSWNPIEWKPKVYFFCHHSSLSSYSWFFCRLTMKIITIIMSPRPCQHLGKEWLADCALDLSWTAARCTWTWSWRGRGGWWWRWSTTTLWRGTGSRTHKLSLITVSAMHSTKQLQQLPQGFEVAAQSAFQFTTSCLHPYCLHCSNFWERNIKWDRSTKVASRHSSGRRTICITPFSYS